MGILESDEAERVEDVLKNSVSCKKKKCFSLYKPKMIKFDPEE